MPPRSNTKKRARYAASSGTASMQAIASPTTETLQTRQITPTIQDHHAKAFELPMELLMEIISYSQHLPTPMTAKDMNALSNSERLLPKEYLERTDVLRSLSQTCKRWRHVFLPLVWERLEPCIARNPAAAFYKTFGDAVLRKSEFVEKNPELAVYVRSASFSVSRYSIETVLPALIKIIHALPNVRTLQLIKVHTQMTSMLKKAFEGYIFPQVETIVLPPYAHNVLRCCPNVRVVICNDRADASKLITAIGKACPKVEEVEGFCGDENQMKRLTKAAPRLQSIKFSNNMTSTAIEKLSSLKMLRHITIYCPCSHQQIGMKDVATVTCVKVAREIVRNSEPRNGKKSVTIEHFGMNMQTGKFGTWSKTLGLYESV